MCRRKRGREAEKPQKHSFTYTLLWVFTVDYNVVIGKIMRLHFIETRITLESVIFKK